MAKDPQDPGAADMLEGETPQESRGRGRPKKHANKAEAQRAASKAYRERKKARREAPEAHSEIIDLSALPAWKVAKSKLGVYENESCRP